MGTRFTLTTQESGAQMLARNSVKIHNMRQGKSYVLELRTDRAGSRAGPRKSLVNNGLDRKLYEPRQFESEMSIVSPMILLDRVWPKSERAGPGRQNSARSQLQYANNAI
jgi:hypothetical protein